MLRQRLMIAVFSMLVATAAFAAPRTFTISADGKNHAGFRIDDTLETIDGFTGKVSGRIVADPQNVAASSVEFTVDMPSLDTGIALRDREMRSYLETSKFPTATFKSVSVSGPQTVSPNIPAEVNVAGDFTVHGVTRRIVVPVRVVFIPAGDQAARSRGPGDWVHASSTFKIRMTDYGIAVPEKLGLSVTDGLDVKLDVFANSK